MDSILLRLSYPDPSNQILLATADFLYCIFGVKSALANNGRPVNRYRLSALSLQKPAFDALVKRLIQQLPTLNSKTLKNARNDTAFLVCLISTNIHMARSYLLDYGRMIASIINNGILGQKELDLNMQLDSSHEDAELLQHFIFLFKCVVETGRTRAENIVNDYGMVSVLIMLVLGPCEFSKVEAIRRNELDNAGWSTLHAIAKHYPLTLINQHGASSLLGFLKVFGNTGEGKMYVLSMCMHTIRLLLSTDSTTNRCTAKVANEVKDYFTERNGIQIFLGVINQLMVREKLDVLGKVAASNALFCCSILGMAGPRQRKLFCKLEGVPTLMLVLRILSNNRFDKSHVDPGFQIALSECICSCVAYEPECLEEFLDSEGILQVLDLLGISEDPTATAHLIGCLLQLCEYPRCMHQLLYWSKTMKTCSDKVSFGDMLGNDLVPRVGDSVQEFENTSDISLASLLCALWKWEETRLRVLRDPDGCIASVTNPLMSLSTVSNEGRIKTGAVRSLLDLCAPESIRQKLFVLVKSIAEMAKTEAILFDGLSVTNQVIMTAILNYDSLKTSEICIEFIDEMYEEGHSNGSARELAKLLTISRNKVSAVLELQRFLVRRHKEKEATTEHEFYCLLKQCRLQDHLMAAKEVDFLARTTNYQFLVEKRLWQRCELETAANDLNAAFIKTSRIHRTSNGHLNITAWTSKTRCVESEPPINKDDFSLDDYQENRDVRRDSARTEAVSDKTSVTSADTFPARGSVDSRLSLGGAPSEVMNATPDPLEGGFYQVSPYLLKDALEKFQSSLAGYKWLKDCMKNDEENGWRVRAKWKQDWYPLDE